MRVAGHDFGRAPQELLDAFGLARRQLFSQRAPLALTERPRRADLVDEEAVAAIGRNAARAGVRLNEVAELFEARHLVADGRRRHVEPRALNEVARTDRFARADVLAHDGAKDGSGP